MLVTSMLTLAATLSPQAPELRVQASGAEQIMRTLDLRGLRGSLPPRTRPPFGSMLVVHQPEFGRFLVDSDQDSWRVEPGFVADRAFAYLEQRAPDASETTSIDLIGSRVVVSGPRENVDLVAQVIRAIELEVTRPIEVVARLHVVDPGARFPPYLRRGTDLGLPPPVWEARSVTRSGVVTALSQRRVTRFLRDVGAQIAQDQHVSDPIVDRMFEGVVLRVEPHAVPGSDDLVLYCDGAVGELHEPLATRATGVADMPALDVPVLENCAATFSGRIANGGALALQLGGDPRGGSSRLLVVEATRAAAPEQPIVDDVVVLPCSALTTTSLSNFVFAHPVDIDDADEWDAIFPLYIADDSVAGGSFAVDSDAVLELLRRVIAPALDADRAALELQGDGWVLVSGDRDACRSAAGALATLHEQWLTSSEIELTTEMRAVESGAGAFAAAGSDGSVGILHRLAAPVLAGRPHFFVRGLESTAIQDFYVEIAQDASTLDPHVVPTFSGLFASCLVHSAGARVGSARVDVEVADVAPLARRSAETRHGGHLYLPATTRSRFVHRGALVTGTPIDLGDAGVVRLDRRSYGLRQKLSVSPR